MIDENYIVTKSNYFIMNGRYDLDLQEQRIILKLASMVQPDDTEFQEYTLQISEFFELLGLKGQSGYSELRKITKNLIGKVIELPTTDGSLKQFAWLTCATYNKNGTINLKFSPDLKPFMLNLSEHFTSYQVNNVMKMKSKYSPRIYEILKCNEFKKQGYIYVELDELKKMLKVENKYNQYGHFKKRILAPSLQEINELSDINFEFEEIKAGRKVERLKFKIKEVTRVLDVGEEQDEDVNDTDDAATDNEPNETDAPKIKEEYPFFSMADVIAEAEKDEVIAELYELMKEKNVSLNEVKRIYESSDYNKVIVKEVFEYCKDRQADNFVGLMIHMVQPGVFKKPKQNIKKTSFHNFDQRNYDFDELEKELLESQKSHQ